VTLADTHNPLRPTGNQHAAIKRSPLAKAIKNRAFVVLCLAATAVSVSVLLMLLTAIALQGFDYLSLDFLSNSPSRKPGRAGIHPALIGSLWVCATCATFALPIGVGTAILLEEFKPKHPLMGRFHGFIQLNITNLAGVPSIVYGILGLTAFVQMFGILGNPLDPVLAIGDREAWYYLQLPIGRGVLAGGLTLMLVVLPVVIISSQESLRAVPNSLREGALALGCTRWQMVSRMTLPAAIPGIMTGAILAMSRAIGEAAPILVIAGIVYITFTPVHLMDDFTAMPLQIYDWAGRPQEEFHKVAASGIIVLLAVLLSFNMIAVIIRQKLQRPMQ
jgi:phosphate transport system permease protein